MKTFNLKLENKHPALAALLVIAFCAFLLAFMGGFIAYWWYVLQYVFNLVVSPIFGIAPISYVQAVGLGLVLSLVKGIDSYKINSIREKVGAKNSYWLLLWPVLLHFVTYLLFA